MKAVMTLLKYATTCQHVWNYRNYHFFRRFQGGFHVVDFFNDTLIFFVYADKTFLWAMRKIVLITLWLDVLFVMSGFTKNAWALAKKSFLQKMNIKNGNVVTANCNVYNETLHLWNFFVFFSTLMDVWFSIMSFLITEALEYQKRRQEVFPKVVITKTVIKNSYVLETFRTIIKIKSNSLRIQFYFLVNLQTQDTMFKRKVFQRKVLVSVSSSIWFFSVP